MRALRWASATTAVLVGLGLWWMSDAAAPPPEPRPVDAPRRQEVTSADAASAPWAEESRVWRPLAASTTAVAPVLQRPAPAEIGSEGFAPMVREALDTGSPQAAAAAAWQLKRCRDMDSYVQSLHHLGTSPKAAQHNDIYKAMISDVQREQRRCQTITPELDSLRSALLLKAMRGAVDGAALDLLYESRERPGMSAAASNEVMAAVRGDAEGGNPYAMSAMSYAAQGVSGVELRAYRRASQLIEAGDEQRQGFLAEFASKLGALGLKLEDMEVFRKEPAAPDIETRVQALLAAHQAWLVRRAAATGS